MNYYKKYTPYLFLLPAVAVLIVFFFIPFFQTFGLSFFDYSSSIYNPTFNGVDNYIKLFKEPIFYKVMFNTFMYLIIAVPFLVTFPLFLAILINQKIRGITLYKILLYLPVIVSIVVAAIAFKWLYAGQGILNYILTLFHLEPIGWLVDTKWALFSVAIVTIWKGIGYYMMIYLASLMSVPQDLYEACDIDGTNFLTKHLNIFLQSDQQDVYLDIDKWKKCGVKDIDFTGKEVTVALDLSLTTDLTAISMMYKENGQYFVKAIGFLPEESLANRREKIDYRALEGENECIITKGAIVDYNQVEEYIRGIEDMYNCSIKCIVADPFNATQMLLSLAEDYEVMELKQSYTNLSPPTKEFRNEVYKGNVVYQKSKLFDWNVGNAITRKDKNENEMLDKGNKNKQRIDLIAATIFAFSQVYQQEEEWAIQII